MIFIKKVLKVIVNIGKIISVVLVLFLLSIAIIAIQISKEPATNSFCKNNFDNQKIELNYEEIESYNCYFDCSTLYFNIIVKDNITENNIKSLLMSIGHELKDLDVFTHFEIYSETLNKTIYASINLKTQQLSMIS